MINMSPRKTRSGPKAVVVESPGKLGKRQSQMQAEASTKSKSKNAAAAQGAPMKKEVAIKVPKVDQQQVIKTSDAREKSKDTTKKTSEKPSKASKQMQSKAETSLGLVPDAEMN